MVRYPRKNNPYVPAATPPDKSLLPVEQSNPTTKLASDTQFQQLNDHIRILEEKLRTIEANAAEKERLQKDVIQKPEHVKASFLEILKKYWLLFLLLFFTYPIFLVYQNWINPTYTSTTGFYVNAQNIKMPDVDVLLSREAQERLLLSNASIANAWVQTVHFPDFIKNVSWILRPIVWSYHKRIVVDKHPTSEGFVLNVQENDMEHAKEFVLALTNEFKRNYSTIRKQKIQSFFARISNQEIDNHKRLERIVEQLNQFRPEEKCSIVSQGIKNNLDQIAKKRALELEQDYARIKEQSKILGSNSQSYKKGFDQVIFYGSTSRLSDMELKKYLISQDVKSLYDGGMQPIKAKIVSLINDYVVVDGNIDVNILIKSTFLKTKFDALSTLLNKRYGVQSSFQGRMAEFAALKLEFEKRYTSMERFINMKEYVKSLLQKDLTLEVIVDMPVIVTKK